MKPQVQMSTRTRKRNYNLETPGLKYWSGKGRKNDKEIASQFSAKS